MKIMVIMIVLLLIVVGLLFWMGTSPSPSQTRKPVKTANPAKMLRAPRGQPAPPAAAQASTSGKGKRNAFDMFTDYATGVTPLRIQQHSKSKLSNIQARHNKELEKALGQ